MITKEQVKEWQSGLNKLHDKYSITGSKERIVGKRVISSRCSEEGVDLTECRFFNILQSAVCLNYKRIRMKVAEIDENFLKELEEAGYIVCLHKIPRGNSFVYTLIVSWRESDEK